MNGDIQVSSQSRDMLESVLQLELENIRLFLELLEHEQSIFAAGVIDDLVLLVADKDRIVSQLSRLDARRNQFLVAAGLPEGAKGIKAWVFVNDAKSTVASDWEELLNLVRLAKQLNQTNASITSVWSQYTRQTLSALHGAAGRITLYGPKGQMA